MNDSVFQEKLEFLKPWSSLQLYVSLHGKNKKQIVAMFDEHIRMETRTRATKRTIAIREAVLMEKLDTIIDGLVECKNQFDKVFGINDEDIYDEDNINI